MKNLIISNSADLVRVPVDKVVYIASDGNYSTLYQANGEERLLTYQLGYIEKIIAAQLSEECDSFIRIGKSLIINRIYVHYINVSKQQLILSDVNLFTYNVSASKEALRQLKELIEKEVE